MKNRKIYLVNCMIWMLLPSLPAQKPYDTFRFSTIKIVEKQDSFSVEMEIIIPKHKMSNCQEWHLTPTIQMDEKVSRLPSIQVVDKKRARLHRRASRSYSPASYHVIEHKRKENRLFYQCSLPRPESGNDLSFFVEGVLISCARKSQSYTWPLEAVREGPHPGQAYVPAIHVNYLEPVATSKERTRKGEARLGFETGKTRFRIDYGRNWEELKEIEETVSMVTKSREMDITTIGLDGYASPEGSWLHNRRLSERRVEGVETFLRNRYHLPGYLFTSQGMGEDWEGLRRLVEEGNLQDKARILAVIDSDLSPDEKEKQLKRMGPVWYILLYDYFPRLRRVQYEISYEIREFSPDELPRWFTEDPSMLNVAELFQLAESYPVDSEEWHTLLQMTAGLYPDDPVALINAAASLMVQGEMLPAGQLLKEVETDPRAWNNLGAWYLITGDSAKAEQYLRKVQGVKGAEANLKELEKLKKEKRQPVVGTYPY